MEWESNYKPGDFVRVKSGKRSFVAVLVRKKSQPKYAWICRKKVADGVWTKESTVNEKVHIVGRAETEPVKDAVIDDCFGKPFVRSDLTVWVGFEAPTAEESVSLSLSVCTGRLTASVRFMAPSSLTWIAEALERGNLEFEFDSNMDEPGHEIRESTNCEVSTTGDKVELSFCGADGPQFAVVMSRDEAVELARMMTRWADEWLNRAEKN